MASEQDDGKNQGDVLTIMTTEHYNLQTARSATISEASGRSSLFLATVSSSLVALGFIAQAAGPKGETFFVFAFVLLPSLFFLGLVTFVRSIELSIEDIVYGRGIARIRHYYLDRVPQMKDYFILGWHDDMAGSTLNMGMLAPRLQPLMTTSGTIAVLDSIIAGSFIALLVSRPLGSSAAALPVSVVLGILIFAASLAVHLRFQSPLMDRRTPSASRCTNGMPSASDARMRRIPKTRS